MFSPAKQLLATPHTQASIMKIEAARRSMATQGLKFPIMRVTVTVGNFVKLMYCDGVQPDQEKPVTVMVPNPILQAALSKTPQSDRPGGSTICSVSVIICL
jgi:hypothetical protein